MGASYSVQHIEPPNINHMDSLDINGNFLLDQPPKVQSGIDKWQKPKAIVERLPQEQPKLTIRSYTWTKESHGLFDYDLKDVLEAIQETEASTNILRNDLAVSFAPEVNDHLIAKISRSGNRHWWIYH